MFDGTGTYQGTFTSDGTNKILSIRSDVDWMRVVNLTQMADTNDVGVEYYWQRGFADGTGIRYFKSGGGNNLNVSTLASPLGFSLINTSDNSIGAAVAVTSTSNVVQPIVATGSTTGLTTGSIIRLSSVANVPNIRGIDFEIDTVVLNTSFRIRYALANAPGAVGGAGSYRIIPYDPIYYPRHRFIADISSAASGVVTTTVQHGYTVGQEVRFVIPSGFGMTQLDGQSATITAVTASTFTINIDTSGYTAFAIPTAATFTAATWAQVTPIGEDTAQALSSSVNILGDATFNTAVLGIQLTGGADSPGGATNDVMYWVAGKSFSNTTS